MECLIGIQGKDFVLMAADCINARSIMKMKGNEDKMYQLDPHMLMAVCGESGDTAQFAEYIEKNITLYRMRNGYSLSPHAAANYTRRILAEYLRSRTPYHVNLLLAGHGNEEGPSLYFMDYLASLNKLNFGVHGYGSYFVLSILDRLWKPDLSQEEAMEILQKCVNEMRTRFIVNLPSFKVKVVNKDGVTILKDMKPTVE